MTRAHPLVVVGACAVLAAAWAGCGAPSSRAPAAVPRFFLEAVPAEAALRVTLPQSEAVVPIGPRPVISEYDVAAVELAELELGRCLLFRLTPAASRAWYRLSGAHQGRRLVLVVDGRALGVRVIEAPVADGALAVFVEVPEAELPALLARLREGVLAVERHAART